MKNNESGYSLVEVLVALLLLFLLLFFSTRIFGYMTINKNNKQKLQAVKYADYYMKQTLLLNEFTDAKFDLPKQYEVRRFIKEEGNLILVEIIVRQKDREITSLKAYEKKKLQ